MLDTRKTATIPAGTVRGVTKRSIMVAIRYEDQEASLLEVFDDGGMRLAKHPGHFFPFWKYKNGYSITPMQLMRIKAILNHKGFHLMDASKQEK